MLHYGGVVFVLAVLVVAMVGTVQCQDIEGTQDGSCPDLGFKKKLKWKKLRGTWNEIMRMESLFEPHQCHATHTYAGTPPNITNTIVTRNTDGTENPANVWPGVIGGDRNKRVFPNAFVSTIYPDPAGIEVETIYTDYKTIHMFWTCTELEDNKHYALIWIEAREGKSPSKKKIKKQMKRFKKAGIDNSRFWNVGPDYC